MHNSPSLLSCLVIYFQFIKWLELLAIQILNLSILRLFLQPYTMVWQQTCSLPLCCGAVVLFILQTIYTLLSIYLPPASRWPCLLPGAAGLPQRSLQCPCCFRSAHWLQETSDCFYCSSWMLRRGWHDGGSIRKEHICVFDCLIHNWGLSWSVSNVSVWRSINYAALLRYRSTQHWDEQLYTVLFITVT